MEIRAIQQTPAPLSTIKTSQTKKNNTTLVSQNKQSKKQNIAILVSSNKKFIDFRKLLSNETVDGGQIVVIPRRNVRKKVVLLNSPKITDPSKILIHVGVNDIDDQYQGGYC